MLAAPVSEFMCALLSLLGGPCSSCSSTPLALTYFQPPFPCGSLSSECRDLIEISQLELCVSVSLSFSLSA